MDKRINQSSVVSGLAPLLRVLPPECIVPARQSYSGWIIHAANALPDHLSHSHCAQRSRILPHTRPTDAALASPDRHAALKLVEPSGVGARPAAEAEADRDQITNTKESTARSRTPSDHGRHHGNNSCDCGCDCDCTASDIPVIVSRRSSTSPHNEPNRYCRA
jgi:hypothetical protein